MFYVCSILISFLLKLRIVFQIIGHSFDTYLIQFETGLDLKFKKL